MSLSDLTLVSSHIVYIGQILHVNIALPPGCLTAFLMDVALLSISPAVHGQLVKLFTW